MRDRLRAPLSIVFVVALLFSSVEAKAEPMKEFIMSCSYGVLAGTLVGAATLAFSDRPGENLNKVARGASIGLYAGILLGLYVVYGIPDEDATASLEVSPRFKIAPVVSDSDSRIVGAVGSYRVFQF